MRAILFFFVFLFFTNANAQTRDLFALAQGDFLGMNALFDEQDNLFGYISIYDYGKTGEKTRKFEYVVMDKNLNPFANNTFEGDITAGDYYGYVSFDGSVILSPSRIDISLIEQKDAFTPSSMVINLKDNTIKRKVFYEFDHGTFTELQQHDTWAENRKERKVEKKQHGFNYVSRVVEIKQGGFLVVDYDHYPAYVRNNHVMRYSEDKKKLWEYEFNQNASKTVSQRLFNLDMDENYYYALLQEHVKSSITSYLLVIDMKTGKEIHKKEIPDPDEVLPEIMRFPTYSYGSLDNDKVFDDKIVVVGRTKSGTFNAGIYFSGISRLLVDKKTFAADLKTLYYKDDFNAYIPGINNRGFVGNGYFIDPRDIFFLRDGSVGILFEKEKAATEYTAEKTTDLVFVYTDKDFKIKGAKVLEKEKSRWHNTDYRFSQNLNDDNDLVFFYRDYQKDEETKDRNWNLFINTYINGTFKQEMIPISSKENFLIIPYIAKEGYILLQEINRKAKYNQVRLERLNY